VDERGSQPLRWRVLKEFHLDPRGTKSLDTTSCFRIWILAADDDPVGASIDDRI
jgi:hypothetical protein